MPTAVIPTESVVEMRGSATSSRLPAVLASTDDANAKKGKINIVDKMTGLHILHQGIPGLVRFY